MADLVAWLKSARTEGIVIGGVAASLLGRPRATRDVDAMVFIDESRWESLLAEGEKFGFKPRHPDALAFAGEARVLLVRHEPSGIDVDIAFGALTFEKEAVERAVWTDVAGARIPLSTPEDLIVMKAVAHRPRDLADIESVLDAHPSLDLARVRRWVREFSAALAMPDILADFEKILASHLGRKDA